jgi:hypothetical protein
LPRKGFSLSGRYALKATAGRGFRDLPRNPKSTKINQNQPKPETFTQWTFQDFCQSTRQTECRLTIDNFLSARFGALDEPLAAITSAIIQLSAEDYTRLLLQLPSLSREELLAQFQA